MSRKPYISNLPVLHQGKVRDTYPTNTPGTRLMVATDAVSTHNVAHLSEVPGKGQILTALSVFWANEVFPDIKTHIIAYGYDVYDYLPLDREYPDDLHLRSIIARDLVMDPHEFIFRARMAGSLWSSYQLGEPNPYGLDLPEGLELMSPFDPPIFTPTGKSETDPPENSLEVERQCPESVALAREVYRRGREFALARGIDIIDFKAETGRGDDGALFLGDEYLTGDCCRFVRSEDITIGQEPPWADKEQFRQAAVKQWGGKKNGPPLEFPDEVIQAGIRAYRDVFWMMTGRMLEKYQHEEY